MLGGEGSARFTPQRADEPQRIQTELAGEEPVNFDKR